MPILKHNMLDTSLSNPPWVYFITIDHEETYELLKANNFNCYGLIYGKKFTTKNAEEGQVIQQSINSSRLSAINPHQFIICVQ